MTIPSGSDLLGAAFSAADFSFESSSDGLNWTITPAPSGLAVNLRSSSDGGDVLQFQFPVGAVTGTHLRVNVAANADAGLTESVSFEVDVYASGQTSQAATVFVPTLPDPTPTSGTGRKKRR